MSTSAKVIDADFGKALQGRGFAPGGAGAPKPPAPIPPRALRDNSIELGRASNGDVVGLHLGKLIEGRLVIQGNSGAGKSMLLRRMFEQSFGRVQQLLIDVDGEFSTLAEKFDVAVFTAADAQRVGGAAFALHLRTHRYSAVLDLSDATSEHQLATVADLVTGLIEVPEQYWNPLLVHVDETQRIAPYYDTGDIDTETRKRAIAALADLMGRGRKRGLAGVIATQRLAETAKAVVSKATNIIVGRTIFDRDLDRSGASLGYTAGHSKALRTLADGEFICLGPALAGPSRLRFKAGPAQSRHKGEAPAIDAPPTLSAAAAAALLGQLPSAAVVDPRDDHIPARTDNRGSGRYWSEAEDNIIRNGYANQVKLTEIARQLAAAGYRLRSVGAVCTRAMALGCKSSSPIAKGAWSPAEDEILVAAYGDPDVKIMDAVGMLTAAGFDRGRVSVQMRVINLGISRDRVNYYTTEETAIVKDGLEAGKSNREIIVELRAAGYHRGVTSISKFAQKHGYDRSHEAWTLEQTAELRAMYERKIPVREIAEKIGKPIGAVRARASNLGLKQRIPWSEAERQILADVHAKGGKLAAAATLIARPYPNVCAEAKRMHLDFRGRT